MTRISALNKPVTYVVNLLEVVFSDSTVRLLEGPAPEEYLGNTYYGSHNDWGAILALDGYSRETGELPSGWKFILRGTPWLISKARDQGIQGSLVRVLTGEIDPDLGIINVELDRQGSINIAKITHGLPGAIEFEVSSTPDYMADPDEQLTLSPNGQKRIDPSDKFCEYMMNVDLELPWGNKNSATPILGQVNTPVRGASGGLISLPGYKNGLLQPYTY